jgi:uncharacterized protein (TIGR04255 family)
VSSLLCLFSYKIKNATPTRVFHNLEVSYDDYNLRFQFGIHNPDYPAPIKHRGFILDYDAYYKGLLEPTDIPNALDNYHKSIQELFEKCITEQTREYLNVKP